MMEKKLVYSIARYEKRSFLGALFYLYRITNNLTIDELLEKTGLNNNQRAFIQHIEKSPQLKTDRIKTIIDYFKITDEELNSYPSVNQKATEKIFTMVDMINSSVKGKIRISWDMLKELDTKPNSFYKFRKIAEDLYSENNGKNYFLSEEEAIKKFAKLYYNDKSYPLRNASFYMYFLINNTNKLKMSKSIHVSTTTFEKIIVGENIDEVRKYDQLKNELIDLYGEDMSKCLALYK